MRSKEDLVAAFTRLGALQPEDWAESEVEEGLAQLGRFAFLREAWRKVIAEGDNDWITAELATDPAEPGGAIVDALQRILHSGANPDDISTVARVMQWKLLFSLCFLINGPTNEELLDLGIAWGLFEVDQDGRPLRPIGGLHESVLGTDPTGREMRARYQNS